MPKALSQCGAGSMPTDHESDRLGHIQQDGRVRTCINLNADPPKVFEGHSLKKKQMIRTRGASKQQSTGVLGDQCSKNKNDFSYEKPFKTQ